MALSTSIRFDDDDAYNWYSIETTIITEIDHVLSRVITYDDGSVKEQEFDETGALYYMFQSDPTNVYTWETIETIYDSDGLSERVIVYDNGNTTEQSFTAGVIATALLIDNGDAYDWSQIETVYDQDGLTAEREVLYDNGVFTAQLFDAGTITYSVSVDVDDFYADAWDVVTRYYTDGELSERQIQYDSGLFTVQVFVDGTLSETTKIDEYGGAGNAYDWSQIVTTYDESGVIEYRETTFDNGVLKYEEFEDGVRTMVYQEDPDDGQGGAEDWQEKLTTYDENGQIETAGTLYDDRDTIIFNYEDGDLTERVRIDGDGDESWLLSVTSFSDVGNETVNYDTVDEVPVEYLDYLDLSFV